MDLGGERSEMKVKELLGILIVADRIRIFRDEKELYSGYKENIAYRDQSVQDVLEAEVKRFRCIPEVTHKHWQELGLMSPLSPEDTPKYEFQNLNLRTYYEIYI